MKRDILSRTSWFMLNKNLCFAVGIEPALFLANLCEKIDMYSQTCEKDDFGNFWLYRTSDKIEQDTTMNYRTQKQCVDILVKTGLIKTKFAGLPRKLFFAVNDDNVIEVLINAKSEFIECQKLTLLDVEKCNASVSEDELIVLQKSQHIYKDIINKDKKKKDIKNKDIIPPHIYEEQKIILENFNNANSRNFKSFHTWSQNYIYWRNYYEIPDIIDAIQNIPTDKFWKDKMTPDILFRIKNTAKENVNYIEYFLNLRNQKNAVLEQGERLFKKWDS